MKCLLKWVLFTREKDLDNSVKKKSKHPIVPARNGITFSDNMKECPRAGHSNNDGRFFYFFIKLFFCAFKKAFSCLLTYMHARTCYNNEGDNGNIFFYSIFLSSFYALFNLERNFALSCVCLPGEHLTLGNEIMS